jgi:hypothetical protein
MKKILIGLAFVMAGGSAWAGDGPLTCWYSETGASVGADSGDQGIPVADYGKVVPNTYEPFAMVITEWSDGNDCPATVTVPG